MGPHGNTLMAHSLRSTGIAINRLYLYTNLFYVPKIFVPHVVLGSSLQK